MMAHPARTDACRHAAERVAAARAFYTTDSCRCRSPLVARIAQRLGLFSFFSWVGEPEAVAPEKQEIALVDEVGVTERIARRERFRH